MRVLLGASNHQQFREAQSWDSLLTSAGLRDLEIWLRSKETAWGEAVVFIETVMPRSKRPSGHRNQFDLLLCFDARMVLCEMKRHPKARNEWIAKAVDQLSGQIDCLKTVLREEGFDDKGLRPFLFCPNLDVRELDVLHRCLIDVHSAFHVWAVGNDQAMRDRSPYYFPEALDRAFSNCSSNLMRGQSSLSKLIENRMRRAGSKLLEFNSFESARAYLRTVVPAQRSFIWETWHVRGLFDESVSSVAALLKSCGTAEIVGPPGSGKSTVAREAIEFLDEDYLEIQLLRHATSRNGIMLFVHEALHGEVQPRASEAALLQSLAEEPMVFWLREYDEANAPALLDFFDALRSFSARRASWIVESNAGLSVFNDCRCELTSLNNSAISKILELVQPGGFFTDPEQVVDLAQGNPRRAITLWRSKTEREATAPSKVEWFLRQLSRDEEKMLPVLCNAAEKTPIGASLRMLSIWAAVAFPEQLSAQRDGALNGLLEKLESEQLARVSRLSLKTFDGYMDPVLLPKELQLTVVDYVAPSVLASVSSELIEKRLVPDTLHLALLEAGKADTLGFVTSALLEGDLEPYFRSSFRSTALPFVPEWCERTNWIPPNACQSYLLRAMRVMAQIGHIADLNAERDCGVPNANDPVQQFVFSVAQARLAAYQPTALDFDLARAVAVGTSGTDADLRAERVVSLARSLQRSNRPVDSWRVLQLLPDLCPPDSSSRFLADYRILEFLNRRKQRRSAVSDLEAYDLISKLSTELIRYAARVENLQAICDALLYFVRSRDLVQQDLSDAEVASYGMILQFVEEYRRRRVRRLQVLLTQGSLHRHACGRQNITWEEFRRHMDAAFLWYQRAMKSAKAQDHLQHLLNALAYLQGIVLKATRFAPSLSASNRSGIIEHAVEILRLTRANLPAQTSRELSREEQALLQTVRGNIPLLMYLAAFGNALTSEQEDYLRTQWRFLAAEAQTHCQERNYGEAVKYRTMLATNLKRILGFGASHDPSQAQVVHAVIQASLEALQEILKPVHLLRKQVPDRFPGE